MRENETEFVLEEIELLKKLAELTVSLKFTSEEKKKQFWQDLRILQYEYFNNSLPEEITAKIERFSGI